MFSKSFSELWGEWFGFFTPNEMIKNIRSLAGANHNGKLYLVVYHACTQFKYIKGLSEFTAVADVFTALKVI